MLTIWYYPFILKLEKSLEWYNNIYKSQFNLSPWYNNRILSLVIICNCISYFIYIINILLNNNKYNLYIQSSFYLHLVQFMLYITWISTLFNFRSLLISFINLILCILLSCISLYVYFIDNVYSYYLYFPYILWLIYNSYLNLYLYICN